MKVLLFRSNNFFDSRVNKYHNYYERASVNYTIVGWDRKGEDLRRDNYDFFRYKAGEDVGGVKAMRNHFMWMRFVFQYLKQHRDVTTIHACDLNAAFPAAFFKCYYKRDVTLIFDACDWFSANFVKSKILSCIFNLMERFTYKWTDKLIICEPEREAQIQFKLREKPLVMPNIPELDMSLITDIQEKYKFNNNLPTIAYMGYFAGSRFIRELIELSETEPFNLLIAGYGNKNIMEKCDSLNNLENFRYLGRVNMIEGLNMENAADVIYAMYCKNVPNHKFAAPNKYYEAMLLSKPLITTKGTIVGDKVEKYGTGWAVEEDVEELKLLIKNLKKEDIIKKGKNAYVLWNKEFKDYIPQFFDSIYSKILK